ncbi:hypothetical protein Mzhil_1192 [Methanosalsum zhilinae DSM 4017]|uniref:Uncharacterized protein n=1 Tax=Methanosalsum zhilinae (strain DSM 4017 / NBRC 107636 / OCM 62 / WeN5) TaxID=679901 RepID=F7XMN2_METZD|nr:hypothetical protein [Methanosalsum zhilinae]AEH61047.1 hypothetical protein Mzhil_1192 [Methanosalsum zhilinae DSM 4017]
MEIIDSEIRERIKDARDVDELNKIYKDIKMQYDIISEKNEYDPSEDLIPKIEGIIEWPVLNGYSLPETSLSWLTLKGPVFTVDDHIITYSDYFDEFVDLNDYL